MPLCIVFAPVLKILMIRTPCRFPDGDEHPSLLDRQMSALAEKEGFNHAILFFADDSIVKFNEGKLPILGKKSYDSSFDKSHDTHAISWYPLAAEVAASFDLGYTWGNWKYAAIDTTMYGNYFTVWKKQADGSWKVKLDGGNNTPKPGLL